MTEQIKVRGEGGAVFTLDLPLHEAIAEQLEKGTLVRLNDDESEPFTGSPIEVAESEAEVPAAEPEVDPTPAEAPAEEVPAEVEPAPEVPADLESEVF